VTGLLRVLVTGSRSWQEPQVIADVLLDCWHDATQLGAPGIVVVHGGARGADAMAGAWAEVNGVAVEPVPAGWDNCGPKCAPGHRRKRGNREWCPTAGHRRNQAMVDRGAAVVVGFWRAPGTGTLDCLARAERAGIPGRRIDAS
jgi:hypothetical protein